MPLYFAYGSNMDVAAMQRRCPRSKPLGRAILPRHRFVIMKEGYASVLRDPARNVHGVLWDVALGDMRPLDAYENVASGLYAKLFQPVKRDGGAAVRALIYVGRGNGDGTPLDGYMSVVIGAARAWALPEPYLRDLASLSPGGASTREGFTEPTGLPKVRPRFATPFDRR